MKRLTSLLVSAIFALSLTACNNQAPLASQQLLTQNTVTAQSQTSIRSDEGLYEFVKIVQKKVFQAYDANKDGFITKPEFKNLEEFFSNIDLDKNGRVSLKEATTSKFFVFDNDAEFERDFQRFIFGRMVDKDADGNASRDEFLGFTMGSNPTAAQSKYYKTLFSKNDINKDGILDFSEYEDAMFQLLKRDIVVKLLDDGGILIIFSGYDK